MKNPKVLFLIFIVMIVGFSFGRMTGLSAIPGLSTIHKDFPLFPTPPKPDAAPVVNAPTQDNDIVIEVPVENAAIAGSFIDVAGRAKSMGGPLRVRIKNSAGEMVTESYLEVNAMDGNAYGRFGQTLSFVTTLSGDVTIEISRASGSGETIVRHVHAGTLSTSDGLTVKVYFAKSMPEGNDCGIVYPVERKIDNQSAAFRSVLETLLKGPTTEEKAAGYVSSIPSGVLLKSAVADGDGVVTADFTRTLERGVTGSCRISAIRSQIDATLRQFAEVRDVVISINGKTSTILQ